MDSTKPKNRASPTAGIAVAVVGIILIIAGGAYALYRRYVIGHTSLTKLAVNPIVDALVIVGIILLIVGVALYYRMRTPKSPAVPPPAEGTSSSPTTTQK
jgi:ABC-type spermidine/putrescine transport system permease subunit II